MTKSPKTPETPSWRTLMRRAKTAPRIEAKQLREQAASLRRAERKAVKAPKVTQSQRNDAMLEAGTRGPRGASQAISRTIPVWQQPNFAEAPGHGEIVGGEVSKMADRLAELARKKGGTDAVQAELAQLIATARYEGQKVADDRHMKEVKDIHHATTDKIVCSAIAAFELQMKQQGGLPPAVTISSYTICRMIDALNRAGYHADGKK